MEGVGGSLWGVWTETLQRPSEHTVNLEDTGSGLESDAAEDTSSAFQKS